MEQNVRERIQRQSSWLGHLLEITFYSKSWVKKMLISGKYLGNMKSLQYNHAILKWSQLPKKGSD